MDIPEVDIKDAISGTTYFKNNIEHLLNYLYPSFHCLELMVKIILHGPDGSGKRMLARLAADSINVKFCEEHVVDMFDENIVGTEKKVRTALSKHSSSGPCLLYLSGYELFCCLEEPDIDRIEYVIKDVLTDLLDSSEQPIIFVASTNDFHRIYKSPLSEIFQHNIQLKSPTFEQAKEIVYALKTKLDIHQDPLEHLNSFKKDNNYHIGNLLHLLAQSEVQYLTKIQELPTKVSFECDTNGIETKNDGTRWLDIGGLTNVKKEIIDAIQLSIDNPQLRKSGLRRTGILLYGPPGTGKTLLAKAVATECSLNFINVKGPELLNEYVGQSEDNVRKLFQKARDSCPSVIFFDEIDSLAPNRGQAGDSGGVMDRIVSQLLAEMDGVGKSDGVFVIGATNRVDLVDPSLLRPGRFDKVLEVPLPAGKENRLQILRALTRKMNLADDVDLEQLESFAPPMMSGADFQGLCSQALQRSFDRCVQSIESGQCNEDDVDIVTTMQDFIESLC